MWMACAFHSCTTTAVSAQSFTRTWCVQWSSFRGAQYGRGLGGLVKVDTRDPAHDRLHGSAAIDLIDAAAAITGPINDKFSAAIAARRSHLDAVLNQVTSKDVAAFFPIPKYYDGQARVRYQPAKTSYLELGGMISSDQVSRTVANSDPAYRKQLWDGGLAAINASDDPLIRYVLATDAASRAIRKTYEARVTGQVDRAAQRIAHARFAIYGTRVYPDATFSLRLSYGKVGGWTANGSSVPAFTRIAGLWERATGQEPFALTQRWLSAKDKLNPMTVFDFVSDNDIIGGNSGSPVVNAKGEVVGAAFDGNIESLGGAFGFDPAVNRTVSVSTAAITEALKTVYGNTGLANELVQH